MSTSLYETGLPAALIDVLRNEVDITTVERARALMKAHPDLFTRWLLKFNLSYETVLEALGG